MIEIARKHWYVKKWKKIELHPLGITEQSHRRNCLETLFCQIIFLQETTTSGVIHLVQLHKVFWKFSKVEHQGRARNYVNPDVLPVLPKTPVVWQHKLKQIAKKNHSHIHSLNILRKAARLLKSLFG